MRRRRSLTPAATLSAAMVLALSAATLPAGAASAAGPDTRQAVYAAASAAWGVPVNVLLGVSYLESRWDTNHGAPSTGAGYGPMHLTDAATLAAAAHHQTGTDARGDDARP
ncbi:hypothetical protein OHA72_26065 [Dactylosporangium sp. NBC_01737]|uniref:hypothetical protein n=1 Tax=Dactylosporangium sp. NBC_01737 TaxID=2975959 RepID=UPI002E12A469|nr:hypothetical protein OHA72_26065 [Dactylosporangium sp. NBC_01737]